MDNRIFPLAKFFGFLLFTLLLISYRPGLEIQGAGPGKSAVTSSSGQNHPVNDLTHWPDWRGSGRSAVWNEPGVMDEFPSDSLPAKWSVPIGSGYSGPTVAEGRVYVSDRREKPAESEGIICLDERTGDKIWEFRYDCAYSGVGYPAGPRASVVIHEGKAYCLGTMGHLHCLDARTGKLVWARDMGKEYEIRMPIWGIAATPLIFGDMIYLQISGSGNACVVALDKNTGREIWRALDDVAAYSAPVIIQKGESKVLVVWSENFLSGLDPGNGKIYWKIARKLRMGMGIATPVLYKDHIFVSSFYDGSMLVKLGDDYRSAEIVWSRSGESERKTDALHCVMNTPVIMDNHIYGVDSYGELRCLDFFSGDRIWESLAPVKKDRWANIHFIQNGDKTWMFNEHGELLITELSPQGYREISRAKIIEPTTSQLPRGVTWSHPAFANKHVFVRNDFEIRCIDLSRP
jgi:outer membrane protein assembly factor BamB